MRRRPAWGKPLWLAVCLVSACAPKTAPPLPAALKYPEFVRPAVPADAQASTAGQGVDRGWRYLQNDNLGEAEREFAGVLRRDPAFHPAQAGNAYVSLARRDNQRALAGFDQALTRVPAYVPALVGKGQALASLGRDEEALAAFESALKGEPGLPDLERRVEGVRLRAVQGALQSARGAAAAGRLAEAKATLERAIGAAPESAPLYRELGIVERRQGDAAVALTHFRRATRLDPFDATSLVQVGELLEEGGDFDGAVVAYRSANEAEPSAALVARIAAAEVKARDAQLPAQFRAIPAAVQLTRGELAALIGVRMEPVVRAAPGQDEVLTDIAGHWAARWIGAVERAGFVEAFENHTFQPAARMRRVDLAVSVSRIVNELARTRPALRARLQQRIAIADVGQSHLNYPQISLAVAAGVLPLLDGNRFDVNRAVSGGEAVDAVERLNALAATR